jgi:hypothetical protein
VVEPAFAVAANQSSAESRTKAKARPQNGAGLVGSNREERFMDA